jgi:sensor histidine kinase regulating citrate/malate metabolism
MQDVLLQNPKTEKNFSLITAMAGEVGNNSFDHNLGNWPDTPGIFFGYDMHRGIVILADRGCGILATLRRVRPLLENHQEALRVAFTEVVSGRAPEQRGNGLKFVAGVVSENNFHLTFQTGDALLEMQPQQKALSMRQAKEWMSGCYMVLQY